MLSRQVLRAAGPRATYASRALGGYGTRAYAAAAIDSKPPVALFGIDGTYASALVSTSYDSLAIQGCKYRSEALQRSGLIPKESQG